MPDQDPTDLRLGKVAIEFDGEQLNARPGETIAATLAAHGRRRLSTARDGGLRGLFCGMGVCHDCRVTVDGKSGIRACMTKVVDGMIIHSPGSR